MAFLARFLYRNLKGYRFIVVIAIIMTFAEVGADIYSAFPLKFIFDKIVNHINPGVVGADSLIGFFDHFGSNLNLRHGEVHTQVGVILFSVALILLLGLISATLSYLQILLATIIAKNLSVRLGNRLFDHLQRLTISWHGQQKAGDLVQRITGNIPDIEKFVADGMVDLMAGILTIIGIIFVMFSTNWQFTILSFLVIPILFLIILFYTRAIKAATKKEKKAEGEVSNVATEAMAEVMEIKAFTFEGLMSSLFTKYMGQKRKFGMRAGRQQAEFTALVDLVLVIGTAIIVGIGAYVAAGNTFALGPLSIQGSASGAAVANAFTLGTLTVFLAFLTKLYQPMRDISKLFNLMSSASSGAERIQNVLDETPEDLTVAPTYSGPRKLSGAVAYQGVYFNYTNSPNEKFILKDINLNIKAGRKVALVGESGSGKTTLTKLIPRFYDLPYPQEVRQHWGSVLVDGIDTRTFPRTIIRENISMVLQDSILFEGTIRDNIAIGRQGATDAEIQHAAEQACIHDVIVKKLGGYDGKIINHGKNLSGGQRQRIAIARAILRNAPILILDEPTAALDIESEIEVMRALTGLTEGRTVLMITHRLSTIGNVDEIVVFEDGRIAEMGSYDQLMKQNGTFKRMEDKQHPPKIDRSAEAGKSMIMPSFVIRTPFTTRAQMVAEMDGKVVATRQLDKVALSVGRIGVGNDIEIASNRVSRLHAKLIWEDEGWVIKDASSLNGLTYNGQRVEQHNLVNGDRIYLAPNIVLSYKDESRVIAAPLPKVPPPAQVSRPMAPVGQMGQVRQMGQVGQMGQSGQNWQDGQSGNGSRQSSRLTPKAQVLIEVDGKVIDRRPLNKEVLTVGRASQNDIPVPPMMISRLHATIRLENGVWVIKDEDHSTHGISFQRYRQKDIPQHTFVNGDRVYLAPTVALRYEVLP